MAQMRRAVAEEMALALMMAKHDRLGRASAVRVLPIEVLQAIAEAATTFHVAANRALLPDFTSIAQAVRKVPDGSTILVHDGDYIEISPIVITSRIALVSASHVAAAAADPASLLQQAGRTVEALPLQKNFQARPSGC